MALPPCIIVVVVDAVGDGAADDPAHALDHPFAASIGVAPGELHGCDVALPDLGILVDYGGRDVHAILAACGLEVARRAGVPRAAAAEVDADPDETFLVPHQIDVMIAGTDGAELRASFLPVGLHIRPGPGICIGILMQASPQYCADEQS